MKKRVLAAMFPVALVVAWAAPAQAATAAPDTQSATINVTCIGVYPLGYCVPGT